METATAPGATTTEYKLTIWAQILSALAIVVGAATSILDILPPSIKWVGPVSAIVGIITSALTALGYQATRSAVKQAALNAASMSPTTTPNNAAANLGRDG